MSDQSPLNDKSNFSEQSKARIDSPTVPSAEALETHRLIQENLKYIRETLAAVKDIQNNIKLLQLWGLFRFLIIIVPIVLGFIYLPPLIKEIVASYRSLFN